MEGGTRQGRSARGHLCDRERSRSPPGSGPSTALGGGPPRQVETSPPAAASSRSQVTGARARPAAEAARPPGPAWSHRAGRFARRGRVSPRRARRRLPGSPGAAAAHRPRHRALATARRRRHEALRPDAARRRLRLPDHPRRDEARDQRPASGPGDEGPYPTLIEYSGYGYANPAGGESSDRADRQPARFRGRRRQHARHRLLGRGVRLLRAAPGARRLRRHRDRRAPAVGAAPQGRDDGRLLRRHQPAVRRRTRRRAWRRSRRCR